MSPAAPDNLDPLAVRGGPLIVTADLPDDLQRWATALRAEHFPRERNYLAAHVTLFHALPPSCEAEACDLLKRLAAGPAPEARLSNVTSLGRGTAFAIESPAMLALRDAMAEHFHGLLSAQDNHRPRLHITVQNKVTAQEAKALQADLAAQFTPRDFRFRGFGLHEYQGGPWREIRRFSFRG